MAYLHKVKAHGNLVFAALVLAAGLHFSCTSDIESLEDILGDSSSSSLPGALVFCSNSAGCAEISAEACISFGGTVVAFCPANSSSSGGNSGGGSVAYEGQTYRTVRIGTQTWFAENLNYAVAGSKCFGEGGEVVIGYDEDGNPITKILSPAEVQANCVKYGRLYDWSTAMGLPSSCNSSSCSNQIQPKHKGICPSGWHVPNNDDWDVLMDNVGGSSTAGKHLKVRSGWNNKEDGSSGNGTDEYGFSALPDGVGGSDGSFYNVGDHGSWRSADEYSSDRAYSWYMRYSDDDAIWIYNPKSFLFSVRCVQD